MAERPTENGLVLSNRQMIPVAAAANMQAGNRNLTQRCRNLRLQAQIDVSVYITDTVGLGAMPTFRSWERLTGHSRHVRQSPSFDVGPPADNELILRPRQAQIFTKSRARILSPQ